MSMVAWRLQKGCLQVDELLHKRGVMLASKCVYCTKEETFQHVFFTNEVASRVWSFLTGVFGITHAPFTTLINVLTPWSYSVKTQGHVRQVVPIIIIWALWEVMIGKTLPSYYGAHQTHRYNEIPTGGVKFSSPSSSPLSSLSSARPAVGLLSPRSALDKAKDDALLPLPDQWIMRRVTRLGPGRQASHEATSASRTLSEGNATLYQQTLELLKELTQEPLKAQEERDVAYQGARAARQDKEGMRRAFIQDSPLRCHRIGVAVLSDFVLNFQDRNSTLSSLAEEYR
ncbi:hypothetical protein LIER_27893 [Lithospermum erythrorhizon]|uniref:Reverse transcriptase zinc-binding domain-containing protein n=1 Tax=Lithospermum erythrorhizon TaxID=34254 RepID=A0AAV3RH92_LITER